MPPCPVGEGPCRPAQYGLDVLADRALLRCGLALIGNPNALAWIEIAGGLFLVYTGIRLELPG
jgi:threonine/homoserine/homoserine lactone efflux protein